MENQSIKFPVSAIVKISICLALGLCAILLRSFHVHFTIPWFQTFFFGAGVVGAAFLLSWAAETLQVDINPRLAIGILALIAVLPEYAVDFYFTWKAAHSDQYRQFAIANMTGANRLLIGMGWSAVILVGAYLFRKNNKAGRQVQSLTLSKDQSIDLVVLAMATLLALTMPLFGKIHLLHGLGMFALFGFYAWRLSKTKSVEPELAGVASHLEHLPKRKRLSVVIGLLLFAGGVLVASSEPFAEGLIASGRSINKDPKFQFLLVQWLAPLASEAPELIVALVFAARGHVVAGLSALLSSKVNQWTLLVGGIPFIFSFGKKMPTSFPLDKVQRAELVLTAAQSLFGIAILSNGRLSSWKAWALLLLFFGQFLFHDAYMHYLMSGIYLAFTILMLAYYRKFIMPALKLTFSTGKTQE